MALSFLRFLEVGGLLLFKALVRVLCMDRKAPSLDGLVRWKLSELIDDAVISHNTLAPLLIADS
jgi:hypothetical protein